MSQLEFIYDSRIIPFPGEHFFIGSDAECALRVDGLKPKHAEVWREADGTWWVRDVSGSGNVRVDGNATWEGQLTGGSFLSVGKADLAVREAGAEGGSGTVRTKSASHDAIPVVGGKPDTKQLRKEKPLPRPSPEPPPKAKRSLDPGDLIENRYRIIQKLAAGGMGEVYKAEHVELHKPVAMKVMLPELSKDVEFVARFKREAIAASRIGHANIVDISDFGRTPEGRFYFVMELLDGKTLTSLIKQGPFSTRRAAHVIVQIARALAAAHDQGIVHRDLKPENVMLLKRPGQPDFVKVLDFGIAKVNDGHGAGGLTQIGMVVGTPQYMSPEQAAGIAVDVRTDIYSLGLMLYEVLTGRPTFTGETPSVLMAMQMTAAPPPLAPGPIELPMPPALEALIFHMLQKKPPDRPESMHEVIERIDPFAQGLATPHRLTASGRMAVSGLMPLAHTPLPRGATQQDTPLAVGPVTPLSPSLAAMQAATPTGATSPLTGQQPGFQTGAPPLTGMQAAPAKTNMALVIALCFAVALLLGIGGAAILMRSDPPSQPIVVAPPPPKKDEPKDVPPPPPPDPGAQKLSLRFETKPTGAEVFEDDVMIGSSPVSLSRERGKVVQLRFELKGYKTASRKVRFEETDRMVLIELEKEKKGGPTPKKEPLHDNPYSNVKELKDLPD